MLRLQLKDCKFVAVVGSLTAVIVVGFAAYWNEQSLKMFYHWFANMRGDVLTVQNERMLKPGESFWECAKSDGDYSKHCPEMVVVPAGKFIMGSPASEEHHFEGPQHEVTIARPFAVSKFEVTFDEWDTCAAHGDCDANVSANGWGRGRQPVINVSWDDAQRYVEWLSRITGQPYRLLSEAEWEYAARAESDKVYSWGDDIGKGNANCSGCDSQWGDRQTAPVGSFAANAFGLHDMHGNVWEWVLDCFSEYRGAPTDGSASSSGDCGFHILRGGSWDSHPLTLRSAKRDWATSDYRLYNIGFRVGRTLTP